VTGGPGALLVSLFNVKWRFSAQAGGVKGSKLCLFSVIMPAKCVSGVSPRFHYRRLPFCFLPLAAILEFSRMILNVNCEQDYGICKDIENYLYLIDKTVLMSGY
jgi:hypothetical protein